MAQHYIVRAILATIRALPGHPRLSVIDLSCGRGELISTLRAEGCTVRGTHYRTDDYEANDRSKPSFITPDLTVDTGVDLTSELPYGSEAFDVVIPLAVRRTPQHDGMRSPRTRSRG